MVVITSCSLQKRISGDCIANDEDSIVGGGSR